MPYAASSKDPYLPAAAHFCWAGAQPGRAPANKPKGDLALPLPSSPQVHLEAAERPPSPGTARPGRPAGHGLPSVSKPIRHKPNNKFMATSGGTGRSPLSVLQDDNSPSAPAPRQGKRHVLGENLGEKKEVDPSRSLKSGNCAWSDLNKENQQCPFVEN
ncbi:cell division cycle-associated protein 3 [Cyanistes caeruleus]|uniref:cell division cycle-associated protein 3 n=1 Tax=Cyanistes caeruleus TaxID=156563 RepID=UPI000CDB15FF|nr:cell division cycle-associated protein 3 [Cyanistes caeruleus]